MTTRQNQIAGGSRAIRVYVPEDVAQYYDSQAQRYNTSVSAAASPVLCAQARGEIKNDFVKQPGTEVNRP